MTTKLTSLSSYLPVKLQLKICALKTGFISFEDILPHLLEASGRASRNPAEGFLQTLIRVDVSSEAQAEIELTITNGIEGARGVGRGRKRRKDFL